MAASMIERAARRRTSSFRLQHASLRLVRIAIVVTGLGLVTISSVSELYYRAEIPIVAGLWACLVFFMIDWIVELLREKRLPSLQHGLTRATAIVPGPLALAAGASQQTAWLFGSLWLLQLVPTTVAEVPQIIRVISKQAKPLAGVFALYLIVFFLSCVCIYLFEHLTNPATFGNIPATLWWASTTGAVDVTPKTFWGHVFAVLIAVSGVAVLGLLMGILSFGLMEESRRREFIEVWDLVVKIPFFNSIGAIGIAEIAGMLRRIDFPEGTIVVRRGSKGDCMYFVVSGEVTVDRAGDLVLLGPGSFFGELALLGDYVRNATIMTSRPTTLLILDAADFRSFAARHPEFSQAIEVEAAQRLTSQHPRHGLA